MGGKNSIFVVDDQLTNYDHFIPIDSVVKASKVTKLFMQHIYRLHSLAKDIVNDCDPKHYQPLEGDV